MNASIFIRTCKKDIEWIPYCLAAIRKYAGGFSEIVIVAPEHERDAFSSISGVRFSFVEQYENDHLGQQLDKLEAWRRVLDGLVVYMDSDCLFTKPVTPATFLINGKVLIPKTPYDSPLVSDARCWRAPTEKFLGWPVEFEYMYRFPLVYWTQTLKNFYEWFVSSKGCLRDAVLASPTSDYYRFGYFSEFNVLGAWAERFDGDDYLFIDRTREPIPERVVKQFWTWGGVAKVKQELEEIIK